MAAAATTNTSEFSVKTILSAVSSMRKSDVVQQTDFTTEITAHISRSTSLNTLLRLAEDLELSYRAHPNHRILTQSILMPLLTAISDKVLAIVEPKTTDSLDVLQQKRDWLCGNDGQNLQGYILNTYFFQNIIGLEWETYKERILKQENDAAKARAAQETLDIYLDLS